MKIKWTKTFLSGYWRGKKDHPDDWNSDTTIPWRRHRLRELPSRCKNFRWATFSEFTHSVDLFVLSFFCYRSSIAHHTRKNSDNKSKRLFWADIILKESWSRKEHFVSNNDFWALFGNDASFRVNTVIKYVGVICSYYVLRLSIVCSVKREVHNELYLFATRWRSLSRDLGPSHQEIHVAYI